MHSAAEATIDHVADGFLTTSFLRYGFVALINVTLNGVENPCQKVSGVRTSPRAESLLGNDRAGLHELVR
jgi:hypothetical protein